MTEPEDRKAARDVFLQWDKDKAGMLTVDEIQEHMAEICKHFNL